MRCSLHAHKAIKHVHWPHPSVNESKGEASLTSNGHICGPYDTVVKWVGQIVGRLRAFGSLRLASSCATGIGGRIATLSGAGAGTLHSTVADLMSDGAGGGIRGLGQSGIALEVAGPLRV